MDIGVKQDGLVHVSEIANKYITDPAEVLKLNQKVQVKVTEVDIARKRIALSIKQVEGPKPLSTESHILREKPDKAPSSSPAVALAKAGKRNTQSPSPAAALAKEGKPFPDKNKSPELSMEDALAALKKKFKNQS